MRSDRLSRQAIRLAQRQSKKAGRPLTREEVLRMRVQTSEPWIRIFVFAMGLLVGAFSFLCYQIGAPVWIWAAVGLCSAIFIGCGVAGRKAYLDRELQKMKGEGPARLLDAIIDGSI